MFTAGCYTAAMRRINIDIRTRRNALHMTQAKLASEVGVTRKTLSHWETGRRTVPPVWRDKLARHLQVDPKVLFQSVQEPTPWRKAVTCDVSKCPTRTNYPVGGTVDEMLRKGWLAEQIYRVASEQLSADDLRVIVEEFPRDTAYELLFIFMIIANGGRLTWTSPARHRCPLLVMDDFLPDYGGHQMQWALEWERDGERFVLFSQIWLKAPYVKWRGRVDFLLLHKQPGQHGQWTCVEFDGRHHSSQTTQDEERAEGLLIPELRYDNKKLFVDQWFPRFLQDLREASQRGAMLEKQRRQQARQRREERILQIEERRAAA